MKGGDLNSYYKLVTNNVSNRSRTCVPAYYPRSSDKDTCPRTTAPEPAADFRPDHRRHALRARALYVITGRIDFGRITVSGKCVNAVTAPPLLPGHFPLPPFGFFRCRPVDAARSTAEPSCATRPARTEIGAQNARRSETPAFLRAKRSRRCRKSQDTEFVRDPAKLPDPGRLLLGATGIFRNVNNVERSHGPEADPRRPIRSPFYPSSLLARLLPPPAAADCGSLCKSRLLVILL